MAEITNDRTLPSEALGPTFALPGLLSRRAFTQSMLASALLWRLQTACAGEPEPEPGTVPVQGSGSLIVAGGGDLSATLRRRIIGGEEGKKVRRMVIIPTAHGDADDPTKRDSFIWPEMREGATSIEFLHTRNRDVANTQVFAEPLDDADLVWVTGGKQVELSLAYYGTLVQEKLRAVLRRGGRVGGTSAGASIVSDPAIIDGRETAQTGPGFGLLPPDYFVDQHFKRFGREIRLSGLVDAKPGSVGFGIHEGTALEIDIPNATALVLGESSVWVYQPQKKTEFKAGATINFKKLGIPMSGANLGVAP